MEQGEFDALKVWYAEWVQIPKYVSTASLAFLAFSLTNLLPKSVGPAPVALRLAWLSLGLAAGLASCGFFAAYIALDIATRIHLTKLLEQLHMQRPTRDTRWISRWGKVSFGTTIVATIFLLSGFLSLVAYVFGLP